MDEPCEQRAWCAAAPVRSLEELGRRGDERQALDTGGKRGGEIERELSAERPAEQRVALGERSKGLVYAPGLRGGGDCPRVPVAASVARQIDGDHAKARRERAHESIPNSEVQTPAVQQHQVSRLTAAVHFVVERTHASCTPRASTAPSSLASASTCASVCAAESVMRSRALPAGTVGGRIATTQ